MIHHVFIAKGLRKIREVEAEIKVCGKTTWAIVGTKRFLLGSSAFYTRPAAERTKLAYLYKAQKLVSFPHYMGAGMIGRDAVRQLDAYKATGKLN